MSCGGNGDKSPNHWSAHISILREEMEKRGIVPPPVDDMRKTFHALQKDIRAEYPDLESEEVKKMAINLLDPAYTDPELIPEYYEHTHAVLAQQAAEKNGPSIEALEQRIADLTAANADPEEINQAKAEYYAALDNAIMDEVEQEISAFPPNATIDNNGVLTLRSDSTVRVPAVATLTENSETYRELTRLRDYSVAEKPTVEQQVEAAILARAAYDGMRHEMQEISGDLAQRIDSQKIRTVADQKTGTQMSAMGGVRYSTWQHEEIRGAIGREIASEQELVPQDVIAIVKGYSEYAGIDYYRAPALREMGLRAKDFAKMNFEPRRVMVNLPERDDSFIPPTAALAVVGNKEAIQNIPTVTRNMREKIAAMPLDQAAREYVAMEYNYRLMSRIVTSLESDAATAVTATGNDTIETQYGKYKAYTTKGGEKWDPDIKREIDKRLAADSKLDSRTISVITSRYLEVAHAARYGVKALSAAGIDPDDYRRTGMGTRKIAPDKPKETKKK